MKKLVLLLIFVSLFVASPIAAKDNNYNSDLFLKDCEIFIKDEGSGMIFKDSQDSFSAATCIGFIKGAGEMYDIFQGFLDKANVKNFPQFYCVPPGVNTNQVAKIWVKHIKDNPLERDVRPIYTYINALKEAFPCTDPQPAK